MTGHTRCLPRGVGIAPFSHSGSEPSSQANEPSPENAGRLPSAHWAAANGCELDLLLALACLVVHLPERCPLCLWDDCLQVGVLHLVLAWVFGQLDRCAWASVCVGVISATASAASASISIRAEARCGAGWLLVKGGGLERFGFPGC
jgi:hypothetical protein